MELSHENINPLRSVVMKKMQTDFNLLRFFSLIELQTFQSSINWMAESAGVDLETALNYQDLLLKSGLWIINSDGQLSAPQTSLNLFAENQTDEEKVHAFLIANASIVESISTDGPCWFENALIATTPDLRTEFIQKVQSAYSEFLKKSQVCQPTELIGWSHVIIDASKVNPNHGGQI